MKHSPLFWLTRIFGFLLAGFVYLFLAEVFTAGFQLGSFVLVAAWGTGYLAATLLSWKYPASSGVTLIVLGVLYLFFAIGQLSFLAISVFSVVPVIIGILMMTEGIRRTPKPQQ